MNLSKIYYRLLIFNNISKYDIIYNQIEQLLKLANINFEYDEDGDFIIKDRDDNKIEILCLMSRAQYVYVRLLSEDPYNPNGVFNLKNIIRKLPEDTMEKFIYELT